MSDTLESRSGQLQYRNFRAGAEGDWEACGADTSVDIELRSGFFEPSADVGSPQAPESEAAVNELEFAAVGVPG